VSLIQFVSDLVKYDPNQTRDDHGRWTSGGGGSASESHPEESRLQQLSSGKVKDVTENTFKKPNIRFLEMQDGSRAVFKMKDDPDSQQLRSNITPGNELERERAAWEVSKIVGMDHMTTPLIPYKHNGEDGILMKMQSGKIALDSEHDLFGGGKEIGRVAMFDYVIGNEDRHGGNWLVDGDKIHLIDHGLTFPESNNIKTTYNMAFNDEAFHAGRGTSTYVLESSPKSYIRPYIEHRQEILGKLKEMGLPKASIDGVDYRITQASKWESWPRTNGL